MKSPSLITIKSESKIKGRPRRIKHFTSINNSDYLYEPRLYILARQLCRDWGEDFVILSGGENDSTVAFDDDLSDMEAQI